MNSKILTGTMSVLLGVMMFVLSGCAENKVKSAVNEVNKQCPVSIGILGTMNSIIYEDNTVVFDFTINEDFTKIDAIVSNSEDMKENIFAGMRTQNTTKLFETMAEADASLCFVFKGKTSGKEAKIALSSSELKELLKKPIASNEEKLKAAISSTNAQMPLDTGTGIIMTELVEKGNVVFYMAKVNDKAQLEQIANSINEIKASQKNMFKVMDPSAKLFFKIIVDAGKGLGYSYYAEGADETIDVVYTNSELKELL